MDARAGDEEDSPCVMCLLVDPDEDPMVYCDGPCGQCVHLGCYGLRGVPEKEFYCTSCEPEHQRRFPKPRCALCFRHDGFMTRTLDHQYTHPMCVYWMQEIEVDEFGRATNLRSLDRDRKFLQCTLCGKKGGGCLQCAYGQCVEAAHPHCAYTARRQMTVRVDVTGRQYALYCDDHAPFVKADDNLYSSLRPMSAQAVEEEPNASAHSFTNTQMDAAALLDSGEKTTTGPTRQRLRRVRDRKSRGGSKKGVDTGLLLRRQQRKEARQKAHKFFDLEAEVSGSASEDENPSRGCSQSPVLSGSFINDGDYTQHTPGTVVGKDGKKKKRVDSADGMALYYRVNRGLESQSQHDESGESPALRLGFRGAEKGLPLLERMYRKLKSRQDKVDGSENGKRKKSTAKQVRSYVEETPLMEAKEVTELRSDTEEASMGTQEEEEEDEGEEEEEEEAEVEIVAIHRRVAVINRSARTANMNASDGSVVSGSSVGAAGPVRRFAHERTAEAGPVVKRRLPLQAIANHIQKQARTDGFPQESQASSASASASAAVPKSQHPVFSSSHLSEVDLTDEW